MSIENSKQKIESLDKDKYIQNLIAQANARYILFNTSEDKGSFPYYTIKDERLNLLALYYLNHGCFLAENKDWESAVIPTEKAALILEYVHGSKNNHTDTSNYYGLISSLAYYVCFQYSKSFILINKISSTTIISNLIFLFLKRDYHLLEREITRIILNESYSDTNLSENFDEEVTDAKIYEIIIAKSLNNYLRFFYSGNQRLLEKAKRDLDIAKEIAEIKNDPGIWWVIRLLLLISEGFGQSSLWNSLSSHFDITSKTTKAYIKSLVYQSPRGIYELFITQRKSLSKVLNTQNKGCVVSIPTSSGKTRIAEIAILDSLTRNPDSKVLYIAPFRSLAFEVENSLEKIFDNVDYAVSHLYGGSLFSKLDEVVIEESQVIIATPEKSKALLRGNTSILNQIKLIIIDEGHLLGPNKRLIVNEIFYEELRFFVERNGGRYLLLSAVLPNAEEISQWLTESKDTVYKDKWRPSDERFGILEWTGNSVNLNWESNDEERPSFNRNFVVAHPLPLEERQRKVRYFPGDKNEAIAAAALKLRNLGSVLIFVGQKKSVFTMARACIKALGDNPIDFNWNNQDDWNTFELACVETYGNDNDWLAYARKGIVCHNSDLHADVRLPLERMMRSGKSLIIISTSTLGQGVNLGVSTVIFSTIHQSGDLITSRDFWNIAGRAGRAFVDHEGKVLVALDTSNTEEKNRTRYLRNTIKEYFDKSKIGLAKSGILILIQYFKSVAEQNSMSFDLLLQLISENRIDTLGEEAKDIDDTLDWIDDTLLSLHSINNEEAEDTNIDYSWIEIFFTKSLAYIQAEYESQISQTEVLQFIESRIKGITKKVGINRVKWMSLIRSGIPLNSDLMIEEKMTDIVNTISDYFTTDGSITAKINLLISVELLISKLPVLEEDEAEVKSINIDLIREKWLNGEPISDIIPLENGINVITKLYTYKLPWILNGIAKKIRNISLEDHAGAIEELSLLVEFGLPNLMSVKVYQAGIRSRSSAKEISQLFDEELWDKSIREYKKDILDNRINFREKLSQRSNDWIDLLSRITKAKQNQIHKISDFRIDGIDKSIKTLNIHSSDDGTDYLVSPDYSFVKATFELGLNLSPFKNIQGVYFEFDPIDNIWKMTVDNPYVRAI